METRKSILMMTNTSNNKNVIGDKIRTGSFYGRSNGVHTVSVTIFNFIGEFKLQATLSLNPTDEDWFDIQLLTKYNQDGPGVKFPLEPDVNGDTGTHAFTFVGQFTYVRAVMNREYLGDMTNDAIYSHGNIDRVMLAY